MTGLYPDHASRKGVRRAFGDAGIKPNFRFEFQTFMPALHFVAEGLATAICDPLSAAGTL